MLRVVINSIWAVTNTFLNRNQIVTHDQQPTSKWRIFRNFLQSTISTFGLPLIQSMTTNDTVYEYVNTLLSNPSTPNHHHLQRSNSGINRHSRANFRRRTHHHHNNVVRIVKPTIHIHNKLDIVFLIGFLDLKKEDFFYKSKTQMARGHQKELARQRNEKSGAGGKPTTQKGTAAAGLTFQCPVCKSQMGDPKTYKQHFESKHPKNELPAELKDV
ncbi:hypothetical protein I4U23_021393 [Adineta vaga]|nr:hypothetical protein I4U23_021393 [Adineta vaga]